MTSYRRPLVGFVLPLVNGDFHAAEDVVQETMLRGQWNGGGGGQRTGGRAGCRAAGDRGALRPVRVPAGGAADDDPGRVVARGRR